MTTHYCLNCGYNLTGLAELRCPECGAEFTHTELYKARVQVERASRRIWSRVVAFPLFVIGLVPVWLLAIGFAAEINEALSILAAWVFGILTFPLLPAALSWSLALRYRKSLITLGWGDRAGRPVRPLWLYCLMFASIFTVLMGLYLFLISLYISGPYWLF